MRALLLRPNHPQEAPSPNNTTLGLGFQHTNLGEWAERDTNFQSMAHGNKQGQSHLFWKGPRKKPFRWVTIIKTVGTSAIDPH